MILGVLFTACQAYEYSHAAFSFAGNIYGATFFMATGFHGAHVIIGTIFLAVCLVRAYQRRTSPSSSTLGFEVAAWYWHFVDVVWLFLFASIYVWGGGGTAPAAVTEPPIRDKIPAGAALGRLLLRIFVAPSYAICDVRCLAPTAPANRAALEINAVAHDPSTPSPIATGLKGRMPPLRQGASVPRLPEGSAEMRGLRPRSRHSPIRATAPPSS